jgi:SAM-dependent methyltransferase
MKCLSCGSTDIFQLYDFGQVPLVNAFDTDYEITSRKYELNLVVCMACKTCQLANAPSGDLLFKNYKHFSRGSIDNMAHLKSVSDFVARNFRKGAYCLEVGCNDGSLMTMLDDAGFNVTGIDPAANMAEEAIHKKCKTLFRHFGKDVTGELKGMTHGQGYDLIIGLNVFAHFPRVQESFEVISDLLSKQGYLMLEVAYALNTVYSGIYDTVYHEHVFNHTLTSIQGMLEKANLTVVFAQKIATQGGSLRIICQMKSSKEAKEFESNQMRLILKTEADFGIVGDSFYRNLHEKIAGSIRSVNSAVETFAPKLDTPIMLAGAPARGVIAVNTSIISSYTNLLPVDDTAAKRGAFFPGTSARICGWSDLKAVTMPQKAILLSWNYKDTLLGKLRSVGFSGQVLSLFPYTEVIEI